MNKATKTEETVHVPYESLKDKPVKKKAPAKKAVAKKTSTKAPAKKVAAKKVKKDESKPETKTDVAVRIFKKEYGKLERKDIIALFMTEAGLTKAGSSTYYANFKKKHEAGEL